MEAQVGDGLSVAAAPVGDRQLQHLGVSVKRGSYGGHRFALAAYESEHTVGRSCPGAEGGVHLV